MKKVLMICIVMLFATLCYADGVTEMMFDDSVFPIEKTVIKRNKGESSYDTRVRELQAEREYSTELRQLIDVLSEKIASYEIADQNRKPIVKEVKQNDIGVLAIIAVAGFMMGKVF